MLGCVSHSFDVVYCLFSKLTFSKNYFRNSISVSNSLDPDQDQHNVGPDLGPNCFYQKMTEVSTSKERVK